MTGRVVANDHFGSSGSSSAGKRDYVLSVRVDERNNTLIVSAPGELLAEIEQRVSDLDVQGERSRKVIRVLNVYGSGSLKSVQDALNLVVGRKQWPRPKQTKPKQPQKTSAQQQPAEAQTPQ